MDCFLSWLIVSWAIFVIGGVVWAIIEDVSPSFDYERELEGSLFSYDYSNKYDTVTDKVVAYFPRRNVSDFNEELAIKHAKLLYEFMGRPEPKIMVFDSPAQCEIAVNHLFANIKTRPRLVWGNLETAVAKLGDDRIVHNIRHYTFSGFGHTCYRMLGSSVETIAELKRIGREQSDKIEAVAKQAGVDLKLDVNGALVAELRDMAKKNPKHAASLEKAIGIIDLQKTNFTYYPRFQRATERTSEMKLYMLGRLIRAHTHSSDSKKIAAALEYLGANTMMIGFWNDYCIMSRMPTDMKTNNRGAFHCVNDKAIKFPDGFGQCFWNGVSIPNKWMRGEVTPKDALLDPNAERRRAAVEILGWHNILKELKAQTLDINSDPLIGTLLQATLPQVGPQKFLQVTCGTGRKFVLPVPWRMTTAHQANAWTYGFAPGDFPAPEVRT